MTAATDSCWARMTNRLSNAGTVQHIKAAAWMLGGAVPQFLPIHPALKGAPLLSAFFVAGYEMMKHPNSGCMLNARPLILSRTWKHITAGAAIAGISGGLSFLACSANTSILCGMGLATLGIGLLAAGRVTYTDVLFRGEYNLIPDAIDLEGAPAGGG